MKKLKRAKQLILPLALRLYETNVYFSIIFFVIDEINTYLKLEIGVVCREIVAFKLVVIFFFKTKQMIIYVCTSEILKTRV